MSKIINKPWGKEEVLEINNRFMVEKLTMFSGHRCSIQYHQIKLETVYVLSGALKIYYGKNLNNLEQKIYYAGDYITVHPGLIHRMEAVEDSTYIECSTPEMDDVVRLSDDYNRVNDVDS